MDAENKEIILIGDYNCNWDPDHSNISAQTGKLKDLATRYQFEQLIKGHTRITDNTATLLDLAFTNKPENIVGAEIELNGSLEINNLGVLKDNRCKIRFLIINNYLPMSR